MRLLLLAALVVAVAAPARAQLGFIPMAGYDIDYEAPMVGLGFEIGLTPGILPFAAAIRPSAEYVFVDNVDLFRVNGDLIGRFGAPGVPFAPYGKAGVGVEFSSSDGGSHTYVGANLGAGLEYNRFLVEGTLGIGDISSGRVAVGYRF
jgi:hypothetical protein